MKKRRAITYVTIAQSIFLNIKFFLQNGLLSYASACSFDFIFSVVPILIMVVLIMVRVLHTSPDLINSFFKIVPKLAEYFDPDTVIQTFGNISVKSISPLELILAVFIIWMARRFFASTLAALRNIFHDQQQRKPIINQVLAFVFELIVVSVVISVVFAFISLRTILALPQFQKIPQFGFIYQGFLSGKFIAYLPNILIFLLITIIYKIAAGTKPSLKLCTAAGFICTVSFWIFRTILHIFLNVSRYNLIYGVLGNAIILLMDIFFFFTFFLFFAQYIFVLQFFDELLLGELYLLPKREDGTMISALRRTLFIRPDFLIAKNTAISYLSAGETLYKDGDKDSNAYYILKGSVKITRSEYSEETLYHRGDFFGELNCILGKKRSSTATAVIDTQIIKIKGETFRFLIQQNPLAARKTLGQISSYFTKIYGLTNTSDL